MQICTLNGIESSVSIATLQTLSRQFPFVEWGVLYKAEEEGFGRYASIAWIDALHNQLELDGSPWRPKLALHITGKAVDDFIHRRGHVSSIVEIFDRVQIDLSDSHCQLSEISGMFERWPDKPIISRHNRENAHYAVLFMRNPNHYFLFDESNGRDLESVNWPAPLYGKQCGYAGCLGPDNIVKELSNIYSVTDGQKFWIDMTMKLRSADNLFNINKAVSTLQLVEYVASRYGKAICSTKN